MRLGAALSSSCELLAASADLPVGLPPERAVQPLLKKYSAFPKSQISLYPSSSRPTRGAYRGRHGRGTGCGGRGSVGRDT
jgi:hypothetical protein